MSKPRRYYNLVQEGRNVDIDIYGDITSWPWLESDVSSYNLAQQIKGLQDVDTITVGINSYGGEVGEGLAIYNALRNSPAKVVTRCDGFACSAASIIFCAGDERIMNESSALMIHNAWTFAEGDASELRKQADVLDAVTEPSIKAYLAVADIEEEELRAMMDAETWLSPEQALDMGFATSIIKTKAEQVSQSVRKKVFEMVINPYQVADPEDPDNQDPENGDQTDPEGGDSTDTDTGSTDTGDGAGEGGEDQDPEADPEEDPEDEPEQHMAQFLSAIFR